MKILHSIVSLGRIPACLMAVLILSTGTGVGFAAAALPAAPGFVVKEIKQISAEQEENFFHGWPTVTRLSNGTLVAGYSGGRDAHSCPFGRAEVMYSTNEGRTWSWPQVVLDTAIDDRDVGLLETNKGTLLLTTFNAIGFDRHQGKGKYVNDPARWERYYQGLPVQDWVGHHGSMMLRSEDGGRSWSAPAMIPVNSPHGPIQLKDGRLLFPGVKGVGQGPTYAGRQTGVWESLDDGLTWHLLAEIPIRPGDDAAQYHELHGVEAADGTLVVQIRSHSGNSSDGGTRHMMQTVSKDGGKTWSVPQSLHFNGYPPHFLRLRDGRLLLTYDQRVAPYGVAARISADNGTTWSEPMLLTKNKEKHDQGYPSTVQLADGSLLTIWYEVMEGKLRAVVRQATWNLK